MTDPNLTTYLRALLQNLPADWLELTTHRLDVYVEKQAKTRFLDGLEALYVAQSADEAALAALPTAYDYIRLGHPLSCVLEWAVAKQNKLAAKCVISFSSRAMPVLAILRKNLFSGKATRVAYVGELPAGFDPDVLRRVYGYRFELVQVEEGRPLTAFDGHTVFLAEWGKAAEFIDHPDADFTVRSAGDLGSLLLIKRAASAAFVANVQHVRRRETIAMTPADCLIALQTMLGQPVAARDADRDAANLTTVRNLLREITQAPTEPLLGSSGLSVQYAIMMGLIHDARDKHPGKAVKFIVPPNCYGGTNDQARRVAACVDGVEIVDLPVDGDDDMVQGVRTVLDRLAREDAVPFIIAEIPTNPRVEVPDLPALKAALTEARVTATGAPAVPPVFILDQTFCPNVHFLGEGETLSTVRAISYASGSKFPSGGRCTAGYCVGNRLAEDLMGKVARHLRLCDNGATAQQIAILAQQLPSMNQRIQAAYHNTRVLVKYIAETLPAAKINFVSEELADQGFTPSVFSLDLPTQGDSPEEREAHKRALNHRLIKLMITELPGDSKHCVSYGQLRGCYWTIPATSTQGTTKEGDKDYIVRASLSPEMDLAGHQRVFATFVAELE